MSANNHPYQTSSGCNQSTIASTPSSSNYADKLKTHLHEVLWRELESILH